MRKFSLFALLAGIVSVVAPLHAGMVFQFDELGNLASSLNGAPFTPMTMGAPGVDPTGGITSQNVLIYNLTSALDSFSFFNGDVPIAGTGGGLIADLRFTDQNGDLPPGSASEVCGGSVQCLMIFYVFNNGGMPADIGFVPTSFLLTQTPPNTVTYNNGQYTFTYTAGVLSYDGTIVPEPGTAVMCILAIGIVAFIRKRSITT